MKVLMDTTDAKIVIEDLQTKPFICSRNSIITDRGYAIVPEEYLDSLEKTVQKNDNDGICISTAKCYSDILQDKYNVKLAVFLDPVGETKLDELGIEDLLLNLKTSLETAINEMEKKDNV